MINHLISYYPPKRACQKALFFTVYFSLSILPSERFLFLNDLSLYIVFLFTLRHEIGEILIGLAGNSVSEKSLLLKNFWAQGEPRPFPALEVPTLFRRRPFLKNSQPAFLFLSPLRRSRRSTSSIPLYLLSFVSLILSFSFSLALLIYIKIKDI